MKTHTFEGYTILQGTSAKENWELLSSSKPEHYFFHLSSFPSGYIILQCDGKPRTPIIQHCAKLCQEGTKYRNLQKLKIDFCPCSNVIKGDKVGEAVYKSNRRVETVSTFSGQDSNLTRSPD